MAAKPPSLIVKADFIALNFLYHATHSHTLNFTKPLRSNNNKPANKKSHIYTYSNVNKSSCMMYDIFMYQSSSSGPIRADNLVS